MNRTAIARWILAAALMMCLPLLSLAEPARVVTPGGKLNMRKSDNEKAKIVTDVPNQAMVEVEEIGETWSRIVYKKKTGYVKTEFLRIPSLLVGKTVYADEGAVLLRREAREDAPIVDVAGSQEPVEVLQAEGEWLQVRRGEISGYAEAAQFSYQLEQPSGKADWMWEEGTLTQNTPLLREPDASAEKIAGLSAGKSVEVTVTDGKYCLVVTAAGCGYVPVSRVCLKGAEDTGEKLAGMTPAAAAEAAAAALKKAYPKAFKQNQLYYQVEALAQKDGIAGPLYRCGFYDEQDRYLFAALVRPKDKAVPLTAAYAGFAAPVKEEEKLLPEGEVALTLSGDSLQVGDALDITVGAWTRHQCAYTLEKEGRQIAKTEPGRHFAAAYRIREAGAYTLTVTVTDDKGLSVSAEAAFRAEGERGLTPLSDVYSQKDGWWDTVAYRKSTMEHSGCAIFALSHALKRMGRTGEETLPENLAKAYALCLTPEGTNNERLITTAARDFGFKTQRLLIQDPKQIVSLLRGGTLFSFRVARGHIAMISGVSEDGTMVRVVDSAPDATFERIVNVSMYYQLRSGSFRTALSLEDIPGARWYLDTDSYGGLEYWMPVSYPAKLGVRMIQP